MLHCDPGSGIWRGSGGGILGGGPVGGRREKKNFPFFFRPPPSQDPPTLAPFPRHSPTFLPALFYHLYVLYDIIIVIIFMFILLFLFLYVQNFFARTMIEQI